MRVIVNIVSGKIRNIYRTNQFPVDCARQRDEVKMGFLKKRLRYIVPFPWGYTISSFMTFLFKMFIFQVQIVPLTPKFLSLCHTATSHRRLLHTYLSMSFNFPFATHNFKLVSVCDFVPAKSN